MFRHSPARRGLLALALASACGAAVADKSAAPATPLWPAKPLRIIVGFPPGSSPDLTARTFSEPLAQALGQPVIVENKVGAGGNIGADAVAKAQDDHTIGLFINGNLTIAKLLNPRVPYDPARDLAPLSLIGVSPLVLAAPVNQPGVPAGADARAFLQAARQAGDRWSYGTPGVGTVGHLGTELLKARTGIAPVHIPYPGYPQVATAMLGGQLQMALLPPALAQAQERAGKLRLIGVTSAGRSALVPHVPSLSEAGVRDFQLEIWNAFAAPASMPAPVRARLSALIGETARSPEVRAKLFQQGWQAVGSSAEGLANRMRADTATMSRVIREQGIRAE
ncbi:ABC transporter substrate-binding protein [Alicycliphilus denitrificans]|uniref:Tripartite tricarboxylate transporter substrate binding protein n=1 Tax=Alicycliphilus denitrificans TaxID=179636 RepID=A0A3R7HNQ1_9BURK|nr:tripartite tricarboxylate transporter substrate binding protein [Alicycliphilus denitrificans]OJW84728.1 MAG: receptor [Alicycliphilus sp. 69-12]MBN9575129.1 tripartite tricarboxylate transporter substrate binding protein [Alicycliphilus denitrificans]RKJ96564.1 tripartite tricarboxylate transporter substrate binding protein [Alicycliphilus denitrificans]BCN40393.1 ABC transporter substrate-binding protein [Alicycliphilus denitrificans]HRO83162.1 tripartite tricarboxylate transporter substr